MLQNPKCTQSTYTNQNELHTAIFRGERINDLKINHAWNTIPRFNTLNCKHKIANKIEIYLNVNR